MSLALPSKKIQALAIIIIAMFVAYGLYAINAKDKILALLTGASEKSGLDFVGGEFNTQSDIDTDNDKLKDWQEILWKTDINNSDTDGDGTMDGQEVIDGRDPIIAGPDDLLPDTRGITDESAQNLSDSIYDNPDNLSTTLSRGLFSQFMALETNGQLTAQSQEKLIADALASVDPKSVPPEYSIADLKITDSNPTTLRTYGNSLATIFSTYQAKIDSNNNNQFAIVTYQEMISALKNLSVPGLVGIYHLQLINNFYFSYTAVVTINSYEQDPLKALLAIQSLQQNAQANITAIGEIATVFKNNDIIFSTTEPGNIWNNY